MAETTKLSGETRADRMSAHSSAIPDSHESVLATPEGADAHSFRGSHTTRLRRSQ